MNQKKTVDLPFSPEDVRSGRLLPGTIRGMQPAEGSDPTAGSRDYSIVIERDGYADIDVAQMFDGVSEVFDPTVMVEFTTHDDPDTMHRIRVGDVIKMRVVINT